MKPHHLAATAMMSVTPGQTSSLPTWLHSQQTSPQPFLLGLLCRHIPPGEYPPWVLHPQAVGLQVLLPDCGTHCSPLFTSDHKRGEIKSAMQRRYRGWGLVPQPVIHPMAA